MPRAGDGRARHPLYQRWRSMRQRCLNPTAYRYDRYGGRGITIAPEWDDFWRYVADLGPMPNDGQKWTIDRIDNEGNYEPGNVRWATYKEQNINRKTPVQPSYMKRGSQ